MDESCDILVVGAGPAGIAAAAAAGETSSKVIVLDDNLAAGGQIWRSGTKSTLPESARRWVEKLNRQSITLVSGSRVVDRAAERKVLVECQQGNAFEIEFEKIILATGARERFLPFPGWTLPNVMGAGGLQALVKGGLSVKGKRIVVAGTGPLLLAVGAYLKASGGNVLAIAEQASRSNVARFGMSILTSPSKLSQAIQLRRQLGNTPYLLNTWPAGAEGDKVVCRVTLMCGGTQRSLEVDYVACGFGLVPNVEVAALFDARISAGAVVVDKEQRTTVSYMYSAGETTGVGGLELSLVEGSIAGYCATGMMQQANTFVSERDRQLKFARLLDKTFSLRGELRELAAVDTFVCRCEDVIFNRMKQFGDWRSAKLMTRCGMGPCQGRICGPAAEFLFGWEIVSNRPPVFPVRIGTIARRE